MNRLINSRQASNSLIKKNVKYDLAVSTGIHNVFFSSKMNNSVSYLSLRADLNYGSITSVSKHKKPFDYFTLHTEINAAKNDNIAGIFASGVISDNKVKLFNNTANTIGIYKEIDVLINTTYKLSATSLTGMLTNRVPLSRSTYLINGLGLSAILMGGTNSRYASEIGKDYSIGPGVSLKISIALKNKIFGEIYGNYKRYWIHTLSGAEGEEFVGLLMTGVNYHLFEKTALGLEFLLYERYGEYEKYPDYSSSNIAVRFYVKQSIK